jgi:hypothetical protein
VFLRKRLQSYENKFEILFNNCYFLELIPAIRSNLFIAFHLFFTFQENFIKAIKRISAAIWARVMVVKTTSPVF